MDGFLAFLISSFKANFLRIFRVETDIIGPMKWVTVKVSSLKQAKLVIYIFVKDAIK
jgi:hypothetical protein